MCRDSEVMGHFGAGALGMRFDRATVDPTCGRPVEAYRTAA